jgi:hypothetical protein
MQVKKAVRILKAKWLLTSNEESLLLQLPVPPEYESLLTDFHKVEEIPAAGKFDGEFEIIDEPGKQGRFEFKGGKTIARGDFSKLVKQTKDIRYSFFGNEGSLYRQTLKILEDKYGIFSFHSCVMYQPKENRLFLIIGGAGSGKSCFMLRGMQMGLELLTAEMGHFSIDKTQLKFYKGALVDNVRIGNLKYNYPFILEKLDVSLGCVENEWGKKIALDMGRFQTKQDVIENPQLVVILPRVEQGRKEHFLQVEQDAQKISRQLFENASEKIGQSVLLFEAVPFVCLDTPDSANCRLKAIQSLLAYKKLEKVVSIVSGPEDCWKNLI